MPHSRQRKPNANPDANPGADPGDRGVHEHGRSEGDPHDRAAERDHLEQVLSCRINSLKPFGLPRRHPFSLEDVGHA